MRHGPFIGTAGWSIPRLLSPRFPGEGTHLQRYARLLRCTEINSSFHRPHAAATYARWAASTPEDFRFCVKIPRTITHDLKLSRARAPLQRFLEESAGLGLKRGPLLLQLPPSLAFDRPVAGRFFQLLRGLYDGALVCEPRHPSWFLQPADSLLVAHRVARVAADPTPAPGGASPGGWPGFAYFRLHGSPRKYWSAYAPDYLAWLADALRQGSEAECWCLFDNTASGAALENAWDLHQLMHGGVRSSTASHLQ